MTPPAILFLALLLDAWLGEPSWLWSRVPHPAVLMGRVVKHLDLALNTGAARKVKGILATLALVLNGLVSGWFLSLFGPVVEIIVLAILLAQRSLTQHLLAVSNGLSISLEQGQRAVAMIVSRDTGSMTAPQVARSAIESGAENMSDGVVAPAFWFLVAGLPGLIAYKMVNTADSMIGYKNSRYAEFGWAAARLDDLLNLIPARLTGLLIALPGRCLKSWRAIAGDAAKHRSPNAGWPESAMARALGVALAGPRSYDGRMQNFPWVHDAGSKSIGAHAIGRSCEMLWHAWSVGLLLVGALTVFC